MSDLLWAVGGVGGNRSMEYIDPRNPNKWSQETIPFRVWGHCLTDLSNNRLIVTGGDQNGVSK